MNGPNKVAKLVAIQGKMGMTWCQSLLIWARTPPKNWAQKKKKKKRQMGQTLYILACEL